MVADHQGGRHQGRVTICCRGFSASRTKQNKRFGNIFGNNLQFPLPAT
jgi:hypothetical protein